MWRDTYPTPYKTLILVKSKLLLRFGIFPKSKHTSQSITGSVQTSRSAHSSSGRETTAGPSWRHNFGCAARSDLSTFYKTANTNLWCLGLLSSTWSLRLTVDIPGFVAGTATQTLLQRSVLRGGEEKKNFDVSCKFSSLCFSSKCLCTQSRHSLLFVCSPLPTANVRHVSAKKGAKSQQNFSRCPSRVQFSFLFSRESNVSRKSTELSL